MADSSAQSKKLAPKARFTSGLAVAVGLVSLLAFVWGVASEPHFVDESAYISQSYFADLFATGDRDDGLWLTYPAYDLPPFPKYLIGGAFKIAGYTTPGPNEAKLWYQNTSSRFEQAGSLVTARMPMVAVGAIGCVAIYAIGVLVSGRLLGVLAAGLLIVNPLYRMHARRAMSDAPAEAFLHVGLALGLWVWKRRLAGETRATDWLATILAGLAFGLSVSSKFSGALGLMVAGAWLVLGWGVVHSRRAGGVSPLSYDDDGDGRQGAHTPRSPGSWVVMKMTLAMIVMGLVAVGVFVGLNPFLTAHPRHRLEEPFATTAKLSLLERVRMMTALRLKVSADQQRMFAHNAVTTPLEKIEVSAVQGFGRFGPFGPSQSDSTRRFDFEQDRGAIVWLPLVAFGAINAWRRGRNEARRGEPPISWALLIHFVLALAVVTAYLPMAWDRYFLPIQAPSALMGGLGMVAIFEASRRVIRGGPRGT